MALTSDFYRGFSALREQSKTKAEFALRTLDLVRFMLNDKKVDPGQFSLLRLGESLGAIDPFDRQGSIRQMVLAPSDTELRSEAEILHESNPGLPTSLFKIVTGELIGRKMIEAYNNDYGYIADRLVTTLPTTVRNQKLAGFKALGGGKEVKEGHPYEETGFEDKYVTTKETKYGRVLSINEETLLFDQTGEIMRRAMLLGEQLRRDRERTIVRGVIDADSGSSIYVYRPQGTGETLYATDGSNYNWIGSGNTTATGSGFNAAVALQDWTDVEIVRRYRATEVKDDRIDGTPAVIAGLNAGELVMLVPENKLGTARYVINATEIRGDNTNERTTFANPVAGFATVLSSPFIDEVGGQAVNDWYVGQFRRQFVWTEVWPVQTFTQDSSSEAAFERDVVMRVKCRYFGGLSAVDSIYVTKVDGA